MVMQCHICNHPVAGNAVFCVNCGADLRGLRASESQPANNAYQQQPQPVQQAAPQQAFSFQPAATAASAVKKGIGLKGIIATAAAVVVLAGGSITAYKLLSGPDPDRNPDEYSEEAGKKAAGAIAGEWDDMSKALGIDALGAEKQKFTISLSDLRVDFDEGYGLESTDLSKLAFELGLAVDNADYRLNGSLDISYGASAASAEIYLDTERVGFGLPSFSDTFYSVEFADIIYELDLPDELIDMVENFENMLPNQSGTDLPSIDEVVKTLQEHFDKLEFEKDDDASPSSPFKGLTVMSAEITPEDVQDTLYDLLDAVEVIMEEMLENPAYSSLFSSIDTYGMSASSMFREIRGVIPDVEFDDCVFSMFVDDKNRMQAFELELKLDKYNSLYLVAGFAGDENLIDHFYAEIAVDNDGYENSLVVESKGKHVPVDGMFTDKTTITVDGQNVFSMDTRWEIGDEFSVELEVEGVSLAVEGSLRTDGNAFDLTINRIGVVSSYYSYYDGETYTSSVDITGSLRIVIEEAKESDFRNMSSAKPFSDLDESDIEDLLAGLERALHADSDVLNILGDAFYREIISNILPDYSDAIWEYYWNYDDWSDFELFN